MNEKMVVLFNPNEQQKEEIKKRMNKIVEEDIGKNSMREAVVKYGTDGTKILAQALSEVAKEAVGQENVEIRYNLDPKTKQELLKHARDCFMKTINLNRTTSTTSTVVQENPIYKAKNLVMDEKYKEAIDIYKQVLQDPTTTENNLKTACADLIIVGTTLSNREEKEMKELAKEAYQTVLNTTAPILETYRDTARKKIKEIEI